MGVWILKDVPKRMHGPSWEIYDVFVFPNTGDGDDHFRFNTEPSRTDGSFRERYINPLCTSVVAYFFATQVLSWVSKIDTGCDMRDARVCAF